jgi:hypothetical protein
MKPFISSRGKVLDSSFLTGSGRVIAEELMKPEGLVLERLFNYLGDLDDRLNQLERSDD